MRVLCASLIGLAGAVDHGAAEKFTSERTVGDWGDLDGRQFASESNSPGVTRRAWGAMELRREIGERV